MQEEQNVEGAPKARMTFGIDAVPAAVIVFFFVLLVLQTGVFSTAYLSTRDSSSDAARAVSVGHADPGADYDVLRTVQQSTAASGHVDRIVVFNPTTPDKTMPAGCEIAPQPGLCNVYTAADFARAKSDFGSGGWAGDDSWPASSRSTDPINPNSIGVRVYVKVNFKSLLPPLVQHTSVVNLQA